MNCSQYRDLVAADVDGMLGAEAQSVQEHRAQCSACRAERARQAAVRDLVRARAARPEAPLGLRTRVRAALEAEELAAGRPQPWWRRRLSWAGAAFAAAAVVVIVTVAGRGSAFDPLVRDYDRVVQGALEIDFRTDAPAALEDFYRQHVADGVPAHVVDLSLAGFRLVGGTLVDFPDRRARLSIYSDGQYLIVCDYRFAAKFPMALPADGQPVFFHRSGVNFCARRSGDEICLLATRMPMDVFRRRVGADVTAG